MKFPMTADFPVLYGAPRDQYSGPLELPQTVSWELISKHEVQAMRNHGQTLRRLAERGGLCPSELVAVLEDRPWKSMLFEDSLRRLAELCGQK